MVFFLTNNITTYSFHVQIHVSAFLNAEVIRGLPTLQGWVFTNLCKSGFLLLHRYRLGGKHADKRPRTGSRSNYFTDTAGQLWLLGDFGTGTAAALSQQHRTRSGQRCKHPVVLIKNGFYVVLNKKCTKLVTQLLHTHKHCHWSGRRQAKLQHNCNQWSVIMVGQWWM